MAGTPKKPRKMKIDYNIDKEVYDDFVRACTKIGYSPNIVTESLLKKFNKTGEFR